MNEICDCCDDGEVCYLIGKSIIAVRCAATAWVSTSTLKLVKFFTTTQGTFENVVG